MEYYSFSHCMKISCNGCKLQRECDENECSNKNKNKKGVRVMANEQNLVPISSRTPRERKEMGRKGAEKTNAKKRARKTLREELIALLSKGDTQSKMSLALIAKAINGDTKAFEVIRDSIGEKPKEQVETSGEQKLEVKIEVIKDNHT